MSAVLPVGGADAFESSGLSLGGLVPLSASDYPGCLAAVLFCRGCPWRCRYCHNAHLQSFGASEIALADVYRFLGTRSGLLDAVVFSGGEATFQNGLLSAVKAVRELGFKVGLHTAAPSLDLLERVLSFVDWVGLDVKAAPEAYPLTTGVADSGKNIPEVLETLLAARVDFEARTTVHSGLINNLQLLELAKYLSGLGVKKYAIQMFRGTGCTDAELVHSNFPMDANIIQKISVLFEKFTLRA